MEEHGYPDPAHLAGVVDDNAFTDLETPHPPCAQACDRRLTERAAKPFINHPCWPMIAG